MKSILILAFLAFFHTVSFSQTQLELNADAAQKYKAADAALNKVYKELMALLDPSEKDLLTKAQRSWIAFRDKHCAYTESFYKGGSIQPLIYLTCMQDITEQRVKQLKESKEEIINR